MQTKCSLNTGQKSGDGETLEHGRNQTPSESMSFAEVFPAKTYPLLESSEDSKGKGLVFGGKCSEFSEVCDRSGLSLRMCLNCESKGCGKCYLRFPQSGTMRNGKLYQRSSSDLPTGDSDCLLLPTPTASSVSGIMSQGMQWVLDRNGIPRRVDPKTGGTYSAGLERLTKHWVFLPMIPQLVEQLMEYPIDWTEIRDSETPSFQLSQNGSDEE